MLIITHSLMCDAKEVDSTHSLCVEKGLIKGLKLVMTKRGVIKQEMHVMCCVCVNCLCVGCSHSN